MGDVTKWNAIKQVDRGTIYVKLSMNRDKNKFEKAIREIMQRESKRSNR